MRRGRWRHHSAGRIRQSLPSEEVGAGTSTAVVKQQVSDWQKTFVYLVVLPGFTAFCRIVNTTNSASLSGANPITMLTTARSPRYARVSASTAENARPLRRSTRRPAEQ